MKGSAFRWLVLVVLVAGTAMLNYSNMVFASRPTDVMAQFGMDQAQLTAISSIGVLPGAFFSVLLGNFFDKRGAGAIRFAGAAMILLAAACQLWRVYADNYVLLFVITFLSGTFFLPTQVLPPKLIEAWFERREMGTAMGMFGSSAGVGIMLAFALSGVLSTTSAALMSSAVGFAVVAVLWVALAKLPTGDPSGDPSGTDMVGSQANQGDRPADPSGTDMVGSQANQGDRPADEDSAEVVTIPELGAPRVSAATVLKSRSMWLVMVCAAFAAGAPLFLNSYMLNAFIAKGMDPAAGSVLAIIFNLSLVIGAIFSGGVASKLGRYNLPYLGFCLAGGALFLVAYLAPIGPITFVLLALAGFLGAASLALNLARIGLLPLTGEFGPENIGIAGGMNNTAMGLGMFFIPTAAAAVLGNNYLGVFITLFGFFAVMAIVGGLIVPELGEKGELAKKASQGGQTH